MRESIYSIKSLQQAPHQDLHQVVLKHLQTEFLRPINAMQQSIFNGIDSFVKKSGQPVILDSACGTGMSTVCLAKKYPEHIVIGVDKSSVRLSKNKEVSDNMQLVQANLVDFWRLIAVSHWPISKHYILYPNPYPKPNDLTKRWQGHPLFPVILRLSANIEIRSNWRIYLEEFQLAVKIASPQAVTNIQVLSSLDVPMTLFEKKYWANSTRTYSLSVQGIS